MPIGRGACLISRPCGRVLIRERGRGAYLRKYGDHNSKSMNKTKIHIASSDNEASIKSDFGHVGVLSIHSQLSYARMFFYILPSSFKTWSTLVKINRYRIIPDERI